ncbi:hypothetical protein HYV49_04355 [Candidatus Pacearchaeota archaeon]|nr:hypothetical protein [Candidatus Pacearchaeota archaeon]
MTEEETENEEEKIVKASCSFCGKEIECPEKMLKVDKHMCYECYKNPPVEISEKELSKIHIDIPINKLNEMFYDAVATQMKEIAFPKIWQERKSELKEISKKELAELMFLEGAMAGAGFLFETMKDKEENDIVEESLK